MFNTENQETNFYFFFFLRFVKRKQSTVNLPGTNKVEIIKKKLLKMVI